MIQSFGETRAELLDLSHVFGSPLREDQVRMRALRCKRRAITTKGTMHPALD